MKTNIIIAALLALLSVATHFVLGGYHIHYYDKLCSGESIPKNNYYQLDCLLPVFDSSHTWSWDRTDLYGAYPWDECNGYAGRAIRCPNHPREQEPEAGM